MKIAAVILIISLLCGCGAGDDALDQAIDLRKNLLEANTCSFHAVITADYADEVYTFQMQCSADSTGNQKLITDKDSAG